MTQINLSKEIAGTVKPVPGVEALRTACIS